MAKWVVDIKGEAGAPSFEITVLRDDYAHGKLSYGWMNKDKLLISSSGGPCRDHLTPLVWDKIVAVAHEVADALNRSEPPSTGGVSK